jgi:hypothetical protein
VLLAFHQRHFFLAHVHSLQIMEAIIFIGLQGLGQSTFYRERFFMTHARISLDMLKTRHREQKLIAAVHWIDGPEGRYFQ